MKITLKQLRTMIDEAIRRLDEDTCPCGIERSDCEYHKPQDTSGDGSMDAKIEALKAYAKKYRLKFIADPKKFYDEIDFEGTVAVAALDQTHEPPMVSLLDDGTFDACKGLDKYDNDDYRPVSFEDVAAGKRVHTDIWD